MGNKIDNRFSLVRFWQLSEFFSQASNLGGQEKAFCQLGLHLGLDWGTGGFQLPSKVPPTARIWRAARAGLGAFYTTLLSQVSPRNQLSFGIKQPLASESFSTPPGPGSCPFGEERGREDTHSASKQSSHNVGKHSFSSTFTRKEIWSVRSLLLALLLITEALGLFAIVDCSVLILLLRGQLSL